MEWSVPLEGSLSIGVCIHRRLLSLALQRASMYVALDECG